MNQAGQRYEIEGQKAKGRCTCSTSSISLAFLASVQQSQTKPRKNTNPPQSGSTEAQKAHKGVEFRHLPDQTPNSPPTTVTTTTATKTATTNPRLKSNFAAIAGFVPILPLPLPVLLLLLLLLLSPSLVLVGILEALVGIVLVGSQL